MVNLAKDIYNKINPEVDCYLEEATSATLPYSVYTYTENPKSNRYGKISTEATGEVSIYSKSIEENQTIVDKVIEKFSNTYNADSMYKISDVKTTKEDNKWVTRFNYTIKNFK